MTHYTVSPVSGEAIDRTGRVVAEAFGFHVDEVTEWFAFAGAQHVRALYADKAIVGGLLRAPMGQFFGGRAVPTLGIAGVGVLPERRRSGAATALVSATLLEANEAGVALSTLYASNVPLYRKLGYGVAGTRHIGRVDVTRISGALGTLAVRRLEDSDRAAMGALYTTSARRRPGHLVRGPYVWDRIFRSWKDRPAFATGIFDDDRMVGYVVWRQHDPDPTYTFQIVDQVAPSRAVAQRIWAFIADQSTMVKAVEGATSPDDPFWLALPWPGPKLRLYAHWMLRLVNLPAAIAHRGFESAPPMAADLQIHDPVIKANGGLWRLIVEDGRGRIEPGGTGSVRITVDGLAALYSGFQRCDQLAARGLLDGGGDQWRLLDSAFAGPPPWTPDHF